MMQIFVVVLILAQIRPAIVQNIDDIHAQTARFNALSTQTPTMQPISQSTPSSTSGKSSSSPSIKPNPSTIPTAPPSRSPTVKRTPPSPLPSRSPTKKPTYSPSATPSRPPTIKPTAKPSVKPSSPPTMKPTATPSAKPTRSPTMKASLSPSAALTNVPTGKASQSLRVPTITTAPTRVPYKSPTLSPSRTIPTPISRNYYRRISYNASTKFLDAFVFETIDDPTHGTVDYVSYSSATAQGLARYVNGQVYLGVDNTTIVNLNSRGRKSLRLLSKRVLNGNNLVVLDLDHMPSTAGKVLGKGCSVWPAFWTLGPNWPYTGEIDVIEYVNTNSRGSTALHTSNGCDMASVPLNSFNSTWSKSSYSGIPETNCYGYATGQDQNSGCALIGPRDSVGNSFNSKAYQSTAAQTAKGGVYAMQWDKDSQIRTYYFPRDKIPQDLKNKTPNPDLWPQPYGRYLIGPNSNCSSNHFKDHRLVFDTTFCGDWAGAVFPYSCGTSTSCPSFVRNNPSEFSEAYWLINFLDVYDFNVTAKI